MLVCVDVFMSASMRVCAHGFQASFNIHWKIAFVFPVRECENCFGACLCVSVFVSAALMCEIWFVCVMCGGYYCMKILWETITTASG